LFKKLKEVEGKREASRLLTVRVTEAYLRKPSILDVNITPDLEVITNGQIRQEHFRSVNPEWLEKRLAEWQNSESQDIRVATPEHPLEILDADFCPVLVVEGQEYLVSIYRDIDPLGWVLPGGCPLNMVEVCDPRAAAEREASEEVLIVRKETAFCYFPYWLNLIEENIKRWQLKVKKLSRPKMEEIILPCKGQARNLVVRRDGKAEKVVRNVSLFLNAKISTLTAVFYYRIYLPGKLGEIEIYDGEKTDKGFPIRRLIRLTDRRGKIAAFFDNRDVKKPDAGTLLTAEWNAPTTEDIADIF